MSFPLYLAVTSVGMFCTPSTGTFWVLLSLRLTGAVEASGFTFSGYVVYMKSCNGMWPSVSGF